MLQMPGQSYRGSLPSLTAKERKTAANIKRHVAKLAGEIGERNMFHYESLQQAAKYIETIWRSLDLQVRKHWYFIGGKEVCNLEIELPGRKKTNEIIIIGAHYDSVFGAIGANDNATGIAAILELARLLKTGKRARTLRFVAFANEEPPFFKTRMMGSLRYAKHCNALKEKIKAMVSIETIGYYDDNTNSQTYPFPFMFFYPNRADFIGFVGNVSSKNLVHTSIRTFRENTQFPSEGAAVPAWIPGVSWSDQWSFWYYGYPAIMITDTAPYRYPYYHTSEDTPDKLDYQRTARVVLGLKHVIANLVNCRL